VGVLQRFERRLEGLVEGAFAKVFGGVVQPVEVAGALQREAADKKQIVGQGRILVPNAYTVELGPTDLERFAEWDAQLRAELASMVKEHAADQGWSFVGPVTVAFERVESLDTGVFRVRSTVLSAPEPVVSTRSGQPHTNGAGRPRLVQPATGGTAERIVVLTQPVTVLGRGADADLRLPDTGVSRAHAEVHVGGDEVHVVDLKSTNGTLVNGRRVRESALHDGDRLDIGATGLIYRDSADEGPR